MRARGPEIYEREMLFPALSIEIRAGPAVLDIRPWLGAGSALERVLKPYWRSLRVYGFQAAQQTVPARTHWRRCL